MEKPDPTSRNINAAALGNRQFLKKRVTVWVIPLPGINPGGFTRTGPCQHEYANAQCPVIHNEVERPKHPPANESENRCPSHRLLLSLRKEQSPSAKPEAL